MKNVKQKYEEDWDVKISSNLSVVLANDINLPEEEHPRVPTVDDDDEISMGKLR